MYTYLIKSEDLYKIGRSNNPEKRIKSIKTANPNAKLIAFGNGIEEKKLHNKYSNKQYKGEWFKLNQNDVVNIIRLLNNDYSGINTEKSKRQFKIYENFTINFGQYKYIKLIHLNSDKELRYLEWCIKNTNISKYTKKAFRWWLKEHGKLDDTNIKYRKTKKRKLKYKNVKKRKY